MDVVVAHDQIWPFRDARFDVIIATQVLEHVEDLNVWKREIFRVLKPGGEAVLSFPFLYNEHGSPLDFRRLTVHEAIRLFPDVELVRLERNGGIGSTLAILFLNWVHIMSCQRFITRLLKAILLPVWVAISLLVNFFGLLINQLDKAEDFYNNIFMVIRKK